MDIYSLFKIGHLPMPTFNLSSEQLHTSVILITILLVLSVFGLKQVRVGAYTAFILSVYRFSKFYSELVYAYSVQ
jgi:hypothetical protein